MVRSHPATAVNAVSDVVDVGVGVTCSGALLARRVHQHHAPRSLTAAESDAAVRLPVPCVPVGSSAAHAHAQPHRHHCHRRAVLRVLRVAKVGVA